MHLTQSGRLQPVALSQSNTPSKGSGARPGILFENTDTIRT